MYNEETCIESNLRKILDALNEFPASWEYILVDDGSVDQSCRIARETLNSHPRCRIIHYPVNRGRGYALRQGFAAAQGQYIITTESDLSWGPGIIRKLYEELISTGNDIVVASVFHEKGGFENVPLLRRLLSKWGNRVMGWCFESNISQFSGMTRGYRREAIQSMHLEENDKEIHLEIIGKTEALGLRISEIPATIQWSEKRAEGRIRKKLSVLRYVIPHLLSSFSQGSLKIFIALALFLFSIGLGFAVFGAINKILSEAGTTKPLIVNYGLMLILMAMVCVLFAGVSVQLWYIKKNLVHIQSQVRALANKDDSGSEKPEDSGDS
ncbi:hypothetical protein UR09_05255 [Candidatus Nitromaritima sp. SCGC AAA799-A02]|nr:hypothetical protein UR09_05255 [Candidatus Nitromaritima sp. SCGC AAA799-A02]